MICQIANRLTKTIDNYLNCYYMTFITTSRMLMQSDTISPQFAYSACLLAVDFPAVYRVVARGGGGSRADTFVPSPGVSALAAGRVLRAVGDSNHTNATCRITIALYRWGFGTTGHGTRLISPSKRRHLLHLLRA